MAEKRDNREGTINDVMELAMLFDKDGNQVWPPIEAVGKVERPGEIVGIATGEEYKPPNPQKDGS